MQSLIKSTAYQRGIPPSFKKFKQAASVFAQSAANVYFHICVKMLLSEIFGGRGDKVIHLISLFCLFSDLVSVSDVCVSGKKNRQCCVRGSCLLTSVSPCQVRAGCWKRRWICGKWGETVEERGRGVSGRAPSLEEMTELTPEACHIRFSASLSNAGLRTKKGASAVTCFWLARLA